MNLYKKSGVDVEKAESLLEKVKEKFPGIGGYAGTFEVNGVRLAATCDGVGTKLKLLTSPSGHICAGIDLVAMSINDLIASGARPLFFLDYFASSTLDGEVYGNVLEGIRRGMDESGSVLIGGETAELPGLFGTSGYDLAGFAVGLSVNEYSPSRVSRGDILAGWPSDGVHSNGFSLIRKIFSDEELRDISGELLRPTRIYSTLIPGKDDNLTSGINSLAHVTGGGIERALKRLLPEGISPEMDDIEFKGIFSKIHEKGVCAEEMVKVFNCGWGMIGALPPESLPAVEASGGRVIGRAV